jgi:hypothetical protein
MMEPTDKEEARAADRGREEDLGFTAPGSRPSLGDPGVVSAMVSEFAQQVVGVRRSYNEDKLSGDQAVEKVRELATEYGRVVMGLDSRYQPLPWHDPARLGRRIKLVVPAEDGVEDPGILLFVALGAALVDLSSQHESGQMADDDVKAQAGEMLQDVVHLILGLR